MTLAETIIRKCERSSRDWKKGESGNRTYYIQQEDYDAIGRKALFEEVETLKREGILTEVRWYQTGIELEWVRYSLSALPKLYERAGIEPKGKRLEEARAFFQQVFRGIHSPWLLKYGQELFARIEEGKMPKEMGQEEWFDLLRRVDQLREPTYKRIFSNGCFRDSKRFERQYQKRLVQLARKYWDVIEDEMSDTEVLSELNLESYSQELCFKGNLRLILNGTELDMGCFRQGSVLNSETLKTIGICGKQSIKKVITVENKANYMAMPYEQGSLILFCHGYFTPLERKFLIRLRQILPEDTQYLHTGDLDYGGIRIFGWIRKQVFPEVRPFRMDRETFLRFQSYGEPMDAGKLEKLRQVKEPLLEELKEMILTTELAIEQECFCLEKNGSMC